ncbi:MAG: hypothetical protein RMI91_11600 [Gemmatales bacterium]|nr:hypothetical protein [Gemmatales bacterium]MDW7995286.1 hypothetical protein [Gemmatales bacterium]
MGKLPDLIQNSPTGALQLFDQLARSYTEIEAHLQQYLESVAQGRLDIETLTVLHQRALSSAELLAKLQQVISSHSDQSSCLPSHFSSKKEQVLAVLSRVLQCLSQAERSTAQWANALRPQAEALHQAQFVQQAYQLALATWAEQATDPPDSHAPEMRSE